MPAILSNILMKKNQDWQRANFEEKKLRPMTPNKSDLDSSS